MELNKQQLKAVNHVDGPCLITACPGSGKTTVIVERVANLINQEKIDPSNLLCITFTNKASQEMLTRIGKKIGVSNLKFFVGTFHSLCSNILRKYGDKIGYTSRFSIIDEKGQEDMIIKVARSLGKTKKEIDVYKIKHALNHWRENLEPDIQLSKRLEDDPLHFAIAKKYLSEIKLHNTIDFSGLLYEAIQLLEKDKELLGRFQNKFKYIMVDEVQDTNYAQFHLVNLLGGKYKNITIVGDLNQSIYAFRNARYKNILDFLKRHKNCEKITLEKNYRSTPQIIAGADKLIKNNSTHMGEEFKTDNPSGSDIFCEGFLSSQEEARWCARRIQDLRDEYGWDYSDISILYRINSLSLELQLSFAHYNIPFTVIGGPSFFDRREIRDCLAMLKFFVNPSDALAFHRVANLFSGVGASTIGKIEKVAADNQINMLQACEKIKNETTKRTLKKVTEKMYDIFSTDDSGMHAGDCLSFLTEEMKYYDVLELKCPQDCEDRKINVEEFVNNASVFGQKNKSIDKYLQNIALASSSDKNADEDSVSLMTCHAAKGLEFPVVFMVGVEKNIMPHAMALADTDNPKESMEEERRICYVGMTRAKKHLFMTYCSARKFRDKQGYLRDRYTSPSPFLAEAGILEENNGKLY